LSLKAASLLHLPVLCLPLLIAGCATGPAAPLSTSRGLSLQGKVQGGQQPIIGAHVYLFAANTTGYGGPGIAPSTTNASVSLLNPIATGNSDPIGAYVTTDATGSFTITNDYSCTPNTQVYLYALGGNPGTGTNPASGLLAILGNCPASGNFLTATPFILVNEVTTVAAAYAFAGFASDATHVSSSGTPLAQTGIANAFGNASNLADLSTGTALATTPAGNGTVPQSEINTLANILAACINSSGKITGPTNPTTCYTLFNNALSGGTTGTLPAETATAALNIAHNPGTNVTNLYAISTPTAAFAPALNIEPSDFSIALLLTGGGLQTPYNLAIDGAGNAWVTNSSSDVSEFSNTGQALSPSSGFTGGGINHPSWIAIDPFGDVWITDYYGAAVSKLAVDGSPISPSTGFQGGGLFGPQGMAIDGLGQVWVGNFSANSQIAKLSNSGVPLSPSSGYINPNANYSYSSIGLAIDSSNDLWVTSPGLNSLEELSNSGVLVSPSVGYSGGGLGNSLFVAIDSQGNIWNVSADEGTVSKFSPAGIPISPSTGFVIGSQEPTGIAIDGAGNAWIALTTGHGIAELSNSGTILSSSFGFASSLGATPYGVAVDGSGNVWATNASATQNDIIELIGAATPVVTPLSTAVKDNTIASRP
jgi:streptogramin lyase